MGQKPETIIPALGESERTRQLDRHPESIARIRFQDCDPFGHLNNGRYLDYFINAREEHLRDFYGLDIYAGRFEERNWVVRSSMVSHLSPARNNQTVLLRTCMLNFSRSSIVVEAVMLTEDGTRILATGWADFRYFDIRTGRPARHEQDLMEMFERVSLRVDFSFQEEKSRISVLKRETAA